MYYNVSSIEVQTTKFSRKANVNKVKKKIGFTDAISNNNNLVMYF